MSIHWDQSAADSLSAARQALERAEEAYAEFQGDEKANDDADLDNYLYPTIDNVDTALTELRNFRACCGVSDNEWNSWVGLGALKK